MALIDYVEYFAYALDLDQRESVLRPALKEFFAAYALYIVGTLGWRSGRHGTHGPPDKAE
jgi:hypothetical protein